MERPNYLLDIPSDEYHAATKRLEYLSSHRLNLFRRCPALYIKHANGEIVEGDTASFMMGRAVHTLVLEGAERFEAEYMVADGPENPKTGKPYGRETRAFKEWAEAQTKSVIATEDFALMEKLRDAVRGHALAADLLAEGFAEGTVRAVWDGVPVQARLDWFDPERGIVADFKTCADLDRFLYDVRDYGYTFQLAFYCRVLELAGYAGMPLKACLIVVEKREPYRVGVYELYSQTLDDANEGEVTKSGPGNSIMIRELKKCRASNVWPTLYESVFHI